VAGAIIEIQERETVTPLDLLACFACLLPPPLAINYAGALITIPRLINELFEART
jgi:hypothetical protein